MSGTGPTSVVWFRRDLRLADNPAWAAATSGAGHVVAAFVVDPVPADRAGPARLRLLRAHLEALHDRLVGLGGGLHLLHGDPAAEIPELCRRTGATSVHVNADVTTYARARDDAVARQLAAVPGGRVELASHWGNLVHPPGSVTAASTGEVHRVFTPFFRAWSSAVPGPWPEPGAARVVPPPDAPRWPAAWPGRDGHGPSGGAAGKGEGEGTALGETGAASPGEAGVASPGEEGATARLAGWLDRVDGYDERRDAPADESGTSLLSADLRFGTLAARHVAEAVGTATAARAAFVRQLAWRDWYAHLLAARPGLARHAMAPEMDRIAWRDDPEGLAAWREGRTGFPFVDAGMRQLAATGWMHNRARMVTASFLVKDLLVDWRLGEAHFRRELVDYDLTQNVGNWQWVAGTGPDAAPYFRVFNPVAQGRKLDPAGDYVRRWVPELAGLPGDAVHAPWELGPLELAAAGIVAGETYPERIVDHAAARDRAIAAYSAARN